MEETLKLSITKNILFLADNLSSTVRVLLLFMQEGLVSLQEKEATMSKPTSFDQNDALFTALMKKQLTFETLKRILSSTGNDHLATKIWHSLQELKGNDMQLKLKHKWWPEEKTLPKAFNDQRKQKGQTIMVDELQSLLATSDGVIVITGLGGVGKSATAKWFARHFGGNYDHIIWIDSDKDRIEKSYKRLALELKINETNNNLYELEDIVRKIFERLSFLKCLWILDNAEAYIGSHGIRHVLPRSTNFHAIFTSRNREWGNVTGDGQIAEFQLDVFSTNDSISFMRNYLASGISYSHPQLKRICDLIQNHPLALQIAVATLNRGKIEIGEYIKTIKTTNLILNVAFDDYEQTINTAMSISLNLIKKNENEFADLAFSILQIVGYLRPDDIALEFCKSIVETSRVRINLAIDLLENYSLVTKKIGIPFMSIHRLLQKVIRVNEKANERETLKKILKCSSSTNPFIDTFVEFKLTPYNLADEELKKEFPNLKLQLFDQIQLIRLLKQNKFEDAVTLSKMIHNSVKLPAARYNYAVCLEKYGEGEKALMIFESLYQDCHEDIEESSLSTDWRSADSCGIMDINKKASRAVIGGQLFLAYADERKFKTIKELLSSNRQVGIKFSTDDLSRIIASIDLLDMSHYDIACKKNGIVLKFKDSALNKVALKDCSIDKDFRFPKKVQSLTFENVAVEENSVALGAYRFIPPSLLTELSICSTRNSAPTEFTISLGDLDSISYITLENCAIDATSGQLISPTCLTLRRVSFLLNGSNLVEDIVVVNDYVCLGQLSLLRLNNSDDDLNDKRSKLCIDLAKKTSLNELHLHHVGILNFKASKWIVKQLLLDQVSFVEENQMSVKSTWIYNRIIDFASIPKSTENLLLTLGLDTTIANGLFESPLENLHSLSLSGYTYDGIIIFCLSHFGNCSNLRNLGLGLPTLRVVNFSETIPKGVKNLKLRTNEKNVTIDNSILTEWLTLCTDDQSYDLLILEFLDGVKISRDADMKLLVTQLGLKRILIGPFLWEEDELSKDYWEDDEDYWEDEEVSNDYWDDDELSKDFLMSTIVDSKAEYYKFENGSGKAVEKSEFNLMPNV